MASTALSGRGADCQLTCSALASSSHRRRSQPRAKDQFIEGSLDDLGRLPVLRDLDLPKAEGAKQGARKQSTLATLHEERPITLTASTTLLDVARTLNDNCEPPMEDSEVMSVAQSAWRITERGDNRFGQHGAWFPLDEVNRMIENQDAFFLLAFLRAHQGPDATFMCTNGLGDRIWLAPHPPRQCQTESLDRDGILQARSSGGITEPQPCSDGVQTHKSEVRECWVSRIRHLYLTNSSLSTP